MRINNISVQNFKAVSQQSIDLNGCSAIITSGNNKGKTSLLRGLIDRFRGHKPELIVKEGEQKGFNVMELSDGCRIEWKFTEKTESFAYITSEGIRMTQGVLSAIGEKYFGTRFDIDKFLTSTPAVQTKELQKIVGLDFDEIDTRYKEAYDERTYANKVFAEVSGRKLQEPEKVEKPELEALRIELNEMRQRNNSINEKYEKENSEHLNAISKFNQKQTEKRVEYNSAIDAVSTLNDLGFTSSDLDKWVKTLQPAEEKELTSLPAPMLENQLEIENKINEANNQQRLYDSYERDLQAYNDWVAEGKKARENQVKADEKVKSIQSEKNKMIAGAKIPEDFKITESGILYNGLPLTDSQISSSAKYIAALKLGSMVLGELRTMHFDASFLDKNSLSDIQKWADENDLQLLIERPDFDGGEIKYNIIEKK